MRQPLGGLKRFKHQGIENNLEKKIRKVVISTLKPATEDRVIALIAYTLKMSNDHIYPYTHFQDDLHLDDIDRLLLIAKLESRFNVFLTSEEASSIETVRDASSFLMKSSAEAA